ncbi:MAG: peptidoglycan-binding protein [Gammaproteobacteria bacterium]|nr:peptidoglycan-binding protein [Gammaproteobacteria bacterium]
MANRIEVSLCSSCISAVLLAMSLSPVHAAEENTLASLITTDLPPAKRGECYGRVSVPAVYKTENVEVVVREPSQSFTITPAAFAEEDYDVQVQPGYTKLTAVQPLYETEEQTLEIAPQSSAWVRDSLDSDQVISEGERRDLELSGVKLNEVEPGTCLYEHYQPATIKRVPQRILVKEASESLEVIPAKFGDDSENIVIRPAHKRLIEVPAVFESSAEEVMIAAATTEWQRGSGPIQRIDNLTGDIMCLVDVPAKYERVPVEVVETDALVTTVSEPEVVETISVQKLVTDAEASRSPLPAEYDSMDKLREAAPAKYKWLEKSQVVAARDGQPTGRAACFKEIPAQIASYDREVVKRPGRFARESIQPLVETITVSKLVSNASSVAVPVPGETITIERVTKVSEAKLEWMSVLCDTNMSTDVITRLQKALKREGYEPGPIDGMLGRGTLTAVERYQQDNNMAHGGLTMDTLTSLGVGL